MWPVASVLRAQGLAVVAWPVQAGAQFEGPRFEVLVAAEDLAVPGQVDPSLEISVVLEQVPEVILGSFILLPEGVELCSEVLFAADGSWPLGSSLVDAVGLWFRDVEHAAEDDLQG